MQPLPLPDSNRQFSHQVPVRTNVHRVPVPGRFWRPVGESLMVFGCEDHIPAKPCIQKSWFKVQKYRFDLCMTFVWPHKHQHVRTLPGSGCLEYVRPRIRVEELRMKLARKIRVLEVRRVVSFHELHDVCALVLLPKVPEPLAELAVAGDREDPPVHEDPDLGLVVPPGQGSGIQTGPVRLVGRCASSSSQ